MKKSLLAISIALQSSIVLAQTAEEPAAVTVTMGDDGAVEVPLSFDFPLYDKLFNTSWMYDNGIISFLQPNTPGAINQWQWSAQPVQNMGNYYIASLWADIAPTSQTHYTYQGDSTFMKYTWTNIAEYYSAGSPQPRYNTFSTTITPDGSVSTSYASVNLQTSSISSGIVGNSAAGEYQSYYWSPCCTSVTSIQDWTFIGSYTPPPPDPEPEPTPVPIVAEPVLQPTAEDSTYQESTGQTPTVVEQIVEPLAPTTVVQTQATETPVTVTILAAPVSQPTAGSTASTTTQATSSIQAVTETSSKTLVQVDAQSVARNNQKSLASLTESVVSTSIQGSIEAGTSSAESSTSSNTTKAAEQTQAILTEYSTSQQAQTIGSTVGSEVKNNQIQTVANINSTSSDTQKTVQNSQDSSSSVSSSGTASNSSTSYNKVAQNNTVDSQNTQQETQQSSTAKTASTGSISNATPDIQQETQQISVSKASDNSSVSYSLPNSQQEVDQSSAVKTSDSTSTNYYSTNNVVNQQDNSYGVSSYSGETTIVAPQESSYFSILQPPTFYNESQDSSISEDTQVAQNTQDLESTLAIFKPQQGSYQESGQNQDQALDYAQLNTEQNSSVENISTSDIPQILSPDEVNPTSVRALAGTSGPPVPFLTEEETEEKSDKNERDVSGDDKALEELASAGTRLETLQVVPVGYFSYLNLVYKDRSFYPERRIYKRQKVVDNQRVLRMLNARSDLTYDKMVKAQYSIGDMTGTMD